MFFLSIFVYSCMASARQSISQVLLGYARVYQYFLFFFIMRGKCQAEHKPGVVLGYAIIISSFESCKTSVRQSISKIILTYASIFVFFSFMRDSVRQNLILVLVVQV